MKLLTEEDFIKLKETFEVFQKCILETYEKYQETGNWDKLEKELYKLARKYKKYAFTPNYYVNFVEYHGSHMKQTKNAMEELGLHTGVQLIEDIQKKRKRHIDDFEDEESFYYKFVEKDLLEGLYAYVIENKSRFR